MENEEALNDISWDNCMFFGQPMGERNTLLPSELDEFSPITIGNETLHKEHKEASTLGNSNMKETKSLWDTMNIKRKKTQKWWWSLEGT